MTYSDSLEFLRGLRRFGMTQGLEKARALAASLGNPQESLRFLHIAGTNGKGSTAAFCESCFRTSGKRVGLYTSPHLLTVRERIQINRKPISEEDFAAGLSRIVALIEENKASSDLTFFEILTGLALWHFARQKVDWVVWETGLGGRLDATNIVNPEISIITNIGLEHTQYLGNTLESIAAEKAGILKPGVPLVSGIHAHAAFHPRSQEVQRVCQVLAEKVKAYGIPWTDIGRDFSAKDRGVDSDSQKAELNGKVYELGLLGAHQATNAACALAALQLLRNSNKISISEEDLETGLAQTRWPGRFEILESEPPLVVDGAHNQEGIESLLTTWNAVFGQTPYHLVLGVMQDKDYERMARLLASQAASVLLVRPNQERALEPSNLVGYFKDMPVEIAPSMEHGWPRIQALHKQGAVLITGSLFLVAEALGCRSGGARPEPAELLNPRAFANP